MEQNKEKVAPESQNRIKKLEKIRELFCSVIKKATVQEIKLFYRWFKADLENSLWPTLRGPFLNFDISPHLEPVFAVREQQNTDVYHAVLRLKPNMNAVRVDYDRMTALHFAALNDDVMQAAMFLYYGCDPNALTKNNATTIDIARSAEMRQVFKDFDELDRHVFAKKYKLNVPIEEEEEGIEVEFPFLDLPSDLQGEVLSKLDLVGLITASLVCKSWRKWTARPLRNFLPNSGDWIIRHMYAETFVTLKIEPYPTVFHFCLEHEMSYTPAQSTADIKRSPRYMYEYPMFEEFVLAHGTDIQKKEIQFDQLKQFIFSEEFPVYWPQWTRGAHATFVKLTDDLGLAIQYNPYNPYNRL